MTRLRLPVIALTLLISPATPGRTSRPTTSTRNTARRSTRRCRGSSPRKASQLRERSSCCRPDSSSSTPRPRRSSRWSRCCKRSAIAPPRRRRAWTCATGPCSAPAPPLVAPAGAPPPNALGDVLAELERLHGDLQFRVIGTAALTTDSGQSGGVSGTALEVQQTAFVQGETLNATIQMFLSAPSSARSSRSSRRQNSISAASASVPLCGAASSSCLAKASLPATARARRPGLLHRALA